MEELIWKYIDNDCTEDEVQKVKHLLANDMTFETMYKEISQLNTMLVNHASMPMADNFRNKLNQNITNQIAASPAQIEIISSKWWVMVAILAMAGIYIAYKLPYSSNPILHVELPIDDRTLTYAIWSMVGFVSLTLLDLMIKRLKTMKNQIHFLA